MRYLLYPERRRISDDEIIQWARDRMIDNWLEAHEPTVDEDAYGRALTAVPSPTLDEAMRELEESGVATFEGRQR